MARPFRRREQVAQHGLHSECLQRARIELVHSDRLRRSVSAHVCVELGIGADCDEMSSGTSQPSTSRSELPVSRPASFVRIEETRTSRVRSCTVSKPLATAPRPAAFLGYFGSGVDDGDRTRDFRIHNPALYH